VENHANFPKPLINFKVRGLEGSILTEKR